MIKLAQRKISLHCHKTTRAVWVCIDPTSSMPSPLSMDLRVCIIATYDGNSTTMEKVAEQFSIGVATINRLLARRRKKGTLEPEPHGGGMPPKLSESHLETLKALVEQQPDATLFELG